ncbi:hypothetical protein Hanom_Chr06g00549481 [Helianthus anomalus]
MLLYMIYIILCHSYHFLGIGLAIGDFFFIYSLTWCIGMRFVLELRVSLEAASLSLGIEARSVYIPPSPDPISSFAICGIYWVWLLLLLYVCSGLQRITFNLNNYSHSPLFAKTCYTLGPLTLTFLKLSVK